VISRAGCGFATAGRVLLLLSLVCQCHCLSEPHTAQGPGARRQEHGYPLAHALYKRAFPRLCQHWHWQIDIMKIASPESGPPYKTSGRSIYKVDGVCGPAWQCMLKNLLYL
jgi:hypothetical protein